MSNIEVEAAGQQIIVEYVEQTINVDPVTTQPIVVTDPATAVSVINGGPPGPPGPAATVTFPVLVPLFEVLGSSGIRFAGHHQFSGLYGTDAPIPLLGLKGKNDQGIYIVHDSLHPMPGFENFYVFLSGSTQVQGDLDVTGTFSINSVLAEDLFEVAGAAAAAIDAHLLADDPHGDRDFATQADQALSDIFTQMVADAITQLETEFSDADQVHIDDPDPHTQYQLRDEKDAPNGYIGADGTGLVPMSALPSSLATDAEVASVVAAAIAAVIDSAPGLLNTLDELAAALGDDPNFAATITGLIASQVAKSLYNANTILAANADDTPIPVTIDEQTVLGRITGGNIGALTPAQIRVLIDLAAQIAAASVGGDLSGTVGNATVSAERIQDVIGTFILGGTGLTFTYDDLGNTATLVVNVDDSTIEINADIVRLKALGVATGHIQNDAITTVKILDANVTAAKLAADSVETAKIKDLNVTTGKLADRAVTWAKTQAMATARILMRTTAGPGDVEELTFAQALAALSGQAGATFDWASHKLSSILPGTLAGDAAIWDQLVGFGIFGDGSDGNVVISVTTTLARDMYYNNLTINNGVTLNTGGFRIFGRGVFTNNGTLACNGNNGANGGGAGTGGAGVSLGGGTAGGTGAVGLGGSGTNAANSYGGIGGNGGTGNPGTNPGGSAGTLTAPVTSRGGIRQFPQNALGQFLANAQIAQVIGGTGGGGGGGDGTAGAGGGGGGGVITVCFYKIDNQGTIQANGGNGGSPVAGSRGGGGAGGGGVILLTCHTLITAGTQQVNPGNIGIHSGGGTATDGAAGAVGTIRTLVLSYP